MIMPQMKEVPKDVEPPKEDVKFVPKFGWCVFITAHILAIFTFGVSLGIFIGTKL